MAQRSVHPMTDGIAPVRHLPGGFYPLCVSAIMTLIRERILDSFRFVLPSWLGLTGLGLGISGESENYPQALRLDPMGNRKTERKNLVRLLLVQA